MTKFCILGGGGSFAIHTAKYILENVEGSSVISIGRNFLREEPFSLNINKLNNFKYYAYHITYEMDLLLDILDKEKPEVIINYAAQGEGAVSWKNSWRFFETNCMGLAKLTENLMNKNWLNRFIQIGTSEMYGSVDHATKEDEPIKPTSPYAASKVAYDMYLSSIFNFQKFPMNIIRPSNAYCPGQLPHRIIPRCIISGLTGVKVPLHGGGRAKKSYIHARDLAKAIILVLNKGKLGEIYNVGPDEPTSIREVTELCAKTLNLKHNELCEVTEDRLGQDSLYWLDSGKIKNLGWRQEIGWDEGLNEMVSWGRKYKNHFKNINFTYTLRG